VLRDTTLAVAAVPLLGTAVRFRQEAVSQPASGLPVVRAVRGGAGGADWHPGWCNPHFCSAYAVEVDGEPYHGNYPLHRTSPLIMEHHEPRIWLYVYLEALADGRYASVEIAELEGPLVGSAWWEQDARVHWSFPLDMATRLAGMITDRLAIADRYADPPQVG
jgi:hypothetical protein